MRDFARIPVTDTKDILETPVRSTDVQRFPKEWAEYKKNENKKITVKANSKSSTKKTQEKKDK